jgi:hypothetical protein
MTLIKRSWGGLIADTCAKAGWGNESGPKPEFLAALIANESGGTQTAARFESAVYLKLTDLANGRVVNYNPAGIRQPINRADLLTACTPSVSMEDSARFSNFLSNIRFCATSWGLTQIMGWHCIELGIGFRLLTEPPDSLATTVTLLQWFCTLYKLGIVADCEKLFACWNTGEPGTVATYDPNYVANGMARMAAYVALP